MKNKLILITGGSSGIGKAAAQELHSLGARIILQARDKDKLESSAQEIGSAENPVSYYSTDLIDQGSVEETARLIVEKEGLPDVIINSAGLGEWLTFKEAKTSHFKETMDSPYIVTALTCKVFYDLMQERGAGQFVIINSAACFFSFPGATGYTPARWALLGFSKALQADLYASNFKVSMIALGKVDSPYFKNNPVSEKRIPYISNWLIPTLSTQAAGRIIANTVRSKKQMVIKPVIMAVFVFLNRLFPRLINMLMRVGKE